MGIAQIKEERGSVKGIQESVVVVAIGSEKAHSVVWHLEVVVERLDLKVYVLKIEVDMKLSRNHTRVVVDEGCMLTCCDGGARVMGIKRLIRRVAVQEESALRIRSIPRALAGAVRGKAIFHAIRSRNAKIKRKPEMLVYITTERGAVVLSPIGRGVRRSIALLIRGFYEANAFYLFFFLCDMTLDSLYHGAYFFGNKLHTEGSFIVFLRNNFIKCLRSCQFCFVIFFMIL